VAAEGGTRGVHERLPKDREDRRAVTEQVRFVEFLLTQGRTNRAHGGEGQLLQRRELEARQDLNKMLVREREQKG
jgi:hypothetical protein